MKSIFSIVFIFISIVLPGRTFYVSPTGNDNNPGTKTQPWLSWHKSINSAYPGDTIYFRGGVWYPTTSITINPNIGIGRNGTYSNPICYFNYPGESPIVDFSKLPLTTSSISGFNINTVTHIKIKGITIRNVFQTTVGQWIAGLMLGRNNTNENNGVVYLENIVSCGHGGTGIWVAGYDTLHMINCDSYNNVDNTSTGNPGGRADGFNITSGGSETDTFRIVYITGCRAWLNSDDGFDISTSKQIHISNCWSFANGRLQGDGVGFKFAYSHVKTPSKRTVFNTISAFNTHDAYGEMNLVEVQNGPVMTFYNNTAYKCETGFFSAMDAYNCDNGYAKVIFRNNLVYNSTNKLFDQTHLFACNYKYPIYTDQKNNSWIPKLENPYWGYNPLITVSDGDFLSIDSTGIGGPRQPDGSLPNIDFLRLSSTSDLIDAGDNVGLPFYGEAPDIGYSEYLNGSVTPPAPIFLGAIIQNTAPSLLEMTFNLPLESIIPTNSSFTVLVNSVQRSVNSIVISGTKVYLTLSSPVLYGNTITVAYTKPTTNPLQTSTGGQAANMTAQPVTNNVGPANPVYLSSSIENSSPSVLSLNYNLSLANIVPSTSSFTVTVNSVQRSVNSVAVLGQKVNLTLSSPVVYGDFVVVAYTKPATNPLQSSSGGLAASMTAQSVNNNVAATVAVPVYISSVIENTTPNILEMYFNLNLATIVPPASSFNIIVNSIKRTVNSVSVSGTKVFLTLSASVVYGDIVTVAYTKPSTNPLQTPAGGQANSFNTSTVINKCIAPVNQAPVINITSPINQSSFFAPANITISANASDIDGNITRVEFYNGTIKLGERTSVPFSYTWYSVPLGTYSITAVAIDNGGLKSTSSAISVNVTKSSPSENRPPVIRIIKPGHNKGLVQDSLKITVEAYDSDGSISKVELFNKETLIGESFNVPYVFPLDSKKEMKYELTAIAYDNLNASSTSDLLILYVTSGEGETEFIKLFPNPTSGLLTMELLTNLVEEKNTITIVNSIGTTVYKEFLMNDDMTKLLDLSFLNAGTYFLIISNESGILVTQKIIKI